MSLSVVVQLGCSNQLVTTSHEKMHKSNDSNHHTHLRTPIEFRHPHQFCSAFFLYHSICVCLCGVRVRERVCMRVCVPVRLSGSQIVDTTTRYACKMLAVMYLQRGPPIVENETTTHRTHRMHRMHT